MKKVLTSSRYGIIFGFLITFLFVGCDEYQNCMKVVEFNIHPYSGSFVIDTLYTKYGYRGKYKAVSKDRKDTLKIFRYEELPKTPEIGDSIVKILNEPNYTLYSKDSFYVMGSDCKIRRMVTFESGLIADIETNQNE